MKHGLIYLLLLVPALACAQNPLTASFGVLPIFQVGQSPMLGGAVRANVGAKLGKRWEVGMMPYMASTRYIWEDYAGGYDLKETVTTLGASPYLRFKQPIGRVGLFAEASYGFSRLTYQYDHPLMDIGKAAPELGETLLAGIGADIPLGKKLAIEVIVPFIQERNLTNLSTTPLRAVLPTVGLRWGK